MNGFKIPWQVANAPDDLARELVLELSSEHPLFGKRFEAIAVRQDRDDVLFKLKDCDLGRYVIVHLTWSRRPELTTWPNSEFFATEVDLRERLEADHIEFECLD